MRCNQNGCKRKAIKVFKIRAFGKIIKIICCGPHFRSLSAQKESVKLDMINRRIGS